MQSNALKEHQKCSMVVWNLAGGTRCLSLTLALQDLEETLRACVRLCSQGKVGTLRSVHSGYPILIQ